MAWRENHVETVAGERGGSHEGEDSTVSEDILLTPTRTMTLD